MPDWWLSLPIFLGIVAWVRLTDLCHSWSHDREQAPATWPYCFCLWPIGLLALYGEEPLSPKETMEACSLRMERELGLVFDGIFLLPGYHGNVESAKEHHGD